MEETYFTLVKKIITLEYKIYLQNHHKQIDKDISNNVIRNKTCLLDFDTYRNIQLRNYELIYCKVSNGII